MELSSEEAQSASQWPINSEPPLEEQTPIQHNDPPQPALTTLGKFLSITLLWAIAIYYFGHEFGNGPPWFVFFGTVLFSIPIFLSGLYFSTINKIQKLAGFKSRGWLHRFSSGRYLLFFIWFIWAPTTTFFLLMQLHVYNLWEWLAFLLVIPLFWIVYQTCRRFVDREMKDYLVTAVALKIARLITPALAFIIYLITLIYFADIPQFDSFNDAIISNKIFTDEIPRCAVVFEFAHWQAYYDGAKDFALGRIGEAESLWALLMLSLGGLVVFFNTCLMLSCFLIPRYEYRRIFTPLSENSIPNPLEPWRAAVTTGVFTLILIFILPSLSSTLESFFRERNKSFSEAREIVDFIVMQIDDKYYKTSTGEEIKKIQAEILRGLDNLRPELKSEIDKAFRRMEGNTDAFLDWYYSLSAEYLRMINLLTGNAETYLAEKLEELLRKGEPFKNVELKIQEIISHHQSANDKYNDKIRALLDRNRIEIPADAKVRIEKSISLNDALNLPAHEDIVDIKDRVGTSGGAGGIAGLASAVIVKKVVAKASAKSAFKAAAQALTKMTTSKTVSTTVGATTGAAIGSIFPGIGTAVGAAVGFLGGVIVGAAVDKGMLMLEEAISREDFKNEILLSIRSARTEYMSQLNIE